MVNYKIDPKILKPYLPNRTEIDLWNDCCYVSVVGFMFLNTKVLGLSVPFHTNFEEVNLRFYVRFKENDVWKRGVVFIKEYVPKTALTLIANTIYGEHYETVSMKHYWEISDNNICVSYSWEKENIENLIKVNTQPNPEMISIGSEEEFITEHYWGYTRLNELTTLEYGVEHPRWEVYKTKDYTIQIDFEKNYGKAFSFLHNQNPDSVFLAEGSFIKVKGGKKI